MADVDFVNYLGTASLAAGALGTASYGIVDGMKVVAWFDLAGFERLFASGRRWPISHRATLDSLLPALRAAYGDETIGLLRAQYRAGRGQGELPRTLRQGVRLGFGMLDADAIVGCAVGLGLPRPIAEMASEALVLARRQRAPASGEAPVPPPPIGEDSRAALARMETAIDARIDAALALADKEYGTQSKVHATAVALAIAFGVGLYLQQPWWACLIVGLAAVPIAPVAKDIATAISEAVKVFRRA